MGMEAASEYTPRRPLFQAFRNGFKRPSDRRKFRRAAAMLLILDVRYRQ